MMRILILGGDERQRKLKTLFESDQNDVQYITEPDQVNLLGSALLKAQAVILPLPVSRDGRLVYSDKSELNIPLEKVIDGLDESKRLFAGIIRDNLKEKLVERNIPYFDYYTDEAFKSRNAFLTAQCALRLMLSNTDEYVVGKRALVTGFGRVGKATSEMLERVGLDVYVAARNEEQKATAYALGYKVLDIYDMESVIRIFDFIFNTVPFHVFSEREVGLMKDIALYIELASKPYGARPEHFKKHKKRLLPAPSLPGRYCSTSAAEAIYRSIRNRIFETGGEENG
ncbi:MAG: dipicolinate synthase subunit DpsA [Acutalibacteraceae bacterium]